MNTRNRGGRRGFALILVVALLALLVLVLVSLATLTRIEAGVGSNSLKQAQARQNARFALDVALGELQRHAGADTRITATADILASPPGAGMRYWTGVWDSADTAYRGWLVSGTENAPLPPFGNPSPSLAVEDLTASTGLTTTTGPMASLQITGGTDGPVPCQLLAGPRTLGTTSGAEARYIVAPLVELEGDAPDGTADVLQGRYAWWIADEGVKASLALPDRLAEIDYGPFAEVPGSSERELRNRLRQQVAFAHQGFHASDAVTSPHHVPRLGFDPGSDANTGLLKNLQARAQLAFMSEASGTSMLTSMRERFHDWTTVASGVLASTSSAFPGLKRDLSRNPGLLGPRFAAWSNYEDYLEPFGEATAPVPTINSRNDFRRRYRIGVPANPSPAPGEIVDRVAPVLSNFVIQFMFLRSSANPEFVNIRARVHVALWNPYTSALVPETLRLRVTGLPTARFETTTGTALGSQSLQTLCDGLFAGGFSLRLPFADRPGIIDEDVASWFPGRVINWRTDSGPAPGRDLLFSAKQLQFIDTGWITSGATAPGAPAGDILALGDSSSLTVELRSASDVLVATYHTRPSGSWTVTVPVGGTPSATSELWSLAFSLRLAQPCFNSALRSADDWLQRAAGDPRRLDLPATEVTMHDPIFPTPTAVAYRGAYSGNNSTLLATNWEGVSVSHRPGFLLNRATGDSSTAGSYGNDTPVFELPRSPILSLGMLQHLQLEAQRPFAIGNSWGAGVVVPGVAAGGTVGSWFDRFFFSGSVPEDNPGEHFFSGSDDRADSAAPEPFPFYHLRAIDTRTAPTSTFSLGTVRGAGDVTSQFLLMQGAFNVNSTSVDAWEAVLRSIRPDVHEDWTVGVLSESSGSAVLSGGELVKDSPAIGDTTQSQTYPASRGSRFFRFSQTAQETFEADASSSTTYSEFNRTRYREGFRGGSGAGGAESDRNLSSAQIRGLARRIVQNIRTHAPFETMAEFVGPKIGAESVIEEAIRNAQVETSPGNFASANLNAGQTGLSSFYLTQADILTAIAPFLQCRSDTFLIRTYGETVNPVTQEIEARAWCEATVQRIPTRVDGGYIAAGATGFGRRFVVTSFRWLSPDDI